MQIITEWIIPFMSGFILLATFLTVVIKPLRVGFINWLRKKTGSNESETQLKEVKDTVDKLVGANRSMLRNAITAIYYRYLDSESLPAYEKENLVELYTSYSELKGNHYIEQIFKDMMEWTVIKKVRG
jgi:hypothetical protein